MTRIRPVVHLLLAMLLAATAAAEAQQILADFDPIPAPYASLISGGDGYLYGTTMYGGDHGRGSVYRIDPSTGLLTTIVSFNQSNGSNPYCGSLLLSGGQLYGTTYMGGESDLGTIFKVDMSSGTLTSLFSFGDTTGQYPRGSLVLIAGSLYGTTSGGGSAGYGTVFRFDLASGTLTMLAQFQNSDGSLPYGGVVEKGGALFGTTSSGGASNGGTVFKVDLASGRLTTLAHLNSSTGMTPYSALVDDGSFLYGTAYSGGGNSRGTIFRVDPQGGAVTPLVSLADATGSRPRAGLAFDGEFLYGAGTAGGANTRGTIFKVDLAGTTVTNLAPFPSGTTAANPYATPIVVGSDVIVPTVGSGANGTGSIVKVSKAGGALDTLYSFPPSSGSTPYEVVINGSYLYGITTSGGDNGGGFVYKIDLDSGVLTRLAALPGSAARYGAPVVYNGALYGTLGNGVYRVDLGTNAVTTVASFGSGSLTGSMPYGGLIEYDGYLWGTTQGGGTSAKGTIYRFDPSTNSATTVANFASIGGQSPYSHLTVSGTYLYGVTYYGGENGNGLLFRFDPAASTLTALASFGGTLNLRYPYAGLAASGSRLYGTTLSNSCVYSYDLTTGTLTTVAALVGSKTGGTLYAGVVPDGNTLYGAANYSGPAGRGLGGGTVYKVDVATGTVTVLASFDGSNGQNPFGNVVLSGNALYGATISGGSKNGGVVYRIPLDRGATTTSLTSSPNPSTFGAPVTFTATVSAGAGGTVSFFDELSYVSLGTATVSGGQASVTTKALAGGTHSVFAWYSGDATHAGSISPPISQVVENANVFTDDPLVAGTTPIKALHLTEVRAAINALRSAVGLASISWSDAQPEGTVIAASHVTALRDALTPALGAIGRVPAYSDQISPGNTVRAVHLQELRDLLK